MARKPSDIESFKRDLQAKLERLIELQEVANMYQQLIETNTIVLSEILRTKQALKDLIKIEGDKISGLISIGAGVFTEGEIRVGEKIIVDVGAGIAIPMSIENAIENLSKKERQVRDAIENARKSILHIQGMISQLQTEINKLREHIEKAEKGKV